MFYSIPSLILDLSSPCQLGAPAGQTHQHTRPGRAYLTAWRHVKPTNFGGCFQAILVAAACHVTELHMTHCNFKSLTGNMRESNRRLFFRDDYMMCACVSIEIMHCYCYYYYHCHWPLPLPLSNYQIITM